jgi:hypothetical protein
LNVATAEMSPKPTAPNAAASASPKEQLAPQAIARKYISADDPLSGAYKMPASAQPLTKQFDDIFHAKFMKIIAEWNSTSNRSDLTQVDRKEIIQSSYEETDEIYFGRRQLSERERKLRALTKLFYKVLSEEPWAESWIRAPDVERKLSRFELHKDSLETAFRLGVPTPREAVKAAREALVKQQEQIRALGDKSLEDICLYKTLSLYRETQHGYFPTQSIARPANNGTIRTPFHLSLDARVDDCLLSLSSALGLTSTTCMTIQDSRSDPVIWSSVRAIVAMILDK